MMDRIEELLGRVVAAQHDVVVLASVAEWERAADAMRRRDDLRQQIADEWREMVAFLEKKRDELDGPTTWEAKERGEIEAILARVKGES